MAKRVFLSDIDLAKNQLLNAKLQNLATHPTVTVGVDTGFTYYNTTDNTVYSYTGVGTTWTDLGKQGAVTAVSIVSTNGFAGSSSGGSTPALTISTTITGLLKGNAAAISAATVRTDYGEPTTGLATGILKNTTGTGAHTIAVAGDFPVLNQNTTGSAAILTTARLINGVSFNGSADITITAAAGTLSGTTLASGVTASSLVSFGATPTFATGATAVTQAPGNNSTALATTAFVTTAISGKANSASPTFTGTVTVPLVPSSPTDAASKGYVDAIKQSIDIKDSVRVASTTNITIASGLINSTVIDGITVVTGDRVLLKNQTTASENGIYVVVASGAASRSEDASISAEVTSGMYTFVSEGTTSGSMGYVLTTADPIVLGTTALVFTQFSGAGQINAGSGLTKTGNTIDVVGTANRIIVNTDSIDIASTYVGQASIITLGNITTGTWSGSTIAVNRGGTGNTTGTATINAAMTGHITSNGTTNVTSLGSFSSANLLTALTDKTGTGTSVFSISPALTGTPTAPTVSAADNSTSIATTAFVKAQGYSTTIGTVRKYSAVLGTNGVLTSISITAATHGLDTSGDYIVQLKEISTNIQVEAEFVTVPTTGLVTINFNTAPATGVYRVTILG